MMIALVTAPADDEFEGRVTMPVEDQKDQKDEDKNEEDQEDDEEKGDDDDDHELVQKKDVDDKATDSDASRFSAKQEGPTLARKYCRLRYVICFDALLIVVVTVFGILLFMKNKQSHHTVLSTATQDPSSPAVTPMDGQLNPSNKIPTSSPLTPRGKWILSAEIVENAVESFGYQVELNHDGTVLAIGSPKANNSRGQVQIYHREMNSLSSFGSRPLRSTRVEGNSTITNVFEDATSDASPFRTRGESITNTFIWKEVREPFTGDHENDMTGLGMDLSADGKHLAIGYPGNGRGYVRAFRFSLERGAWLQRGQTLVGPADSSMFGRAVSISHNGNFLAIGAPYHGDLEQGWVQSYQIAANETRWVPHGEPVTGKNPYDHFGYSVTASSFGKFMWIGAPGDSSRWERGGSVQVFVYMTEARARYLQQVNQELFYALCYGTFPCWEEWDPRTMPSNGMHESFGSVVRADTFGEYVASAAALHSDVLFGKHVGQVRAAQVDESFKTIEEFTVGILGKVANEQFGTSLCLDSYGNTFAASTANRKDNALSGVVRVYSSEDSIGRRRWFELSDEIGPFQLGQEEWFDAKGPSVALRGDGSALAIGYQSLEVNEEDTHVVKIYDFRPY